MKVQCDRWKQVIEAHCKKAFPPIRIRNAKISSFKSYVLIQKRNTLKNRQENNKTNSEEDNELLHLEKQIADIIAEEQREKAMKFKRFCVENGSVNVSEMWKLKKKLWPKNKDSIPTGKFNHQGKLVTSLHDLKNLLA